MYPPFFFFFGGEKQPKVADHFIAKQSETKNLKTSKATHSVQMTTEKDILAVLAKAWLKALPCLSVREKEKF